MSAETEEDAVAIARHERMGYSGRNGATEKYTATRAEFLYPKENK